MTRRIRWVSRIAPIVLSLPVSSLAPAQAVRGTVTELAGGGPARAAVVTLERANVDSSLVESSTLSNSTGAYAINAPGSGTYRLVVRRIGSLRYRSAPFSLARGQIHVVNVVLEPVTRRDAVSVLGTVSISRATPCPMSGVNGERIATLWEDARTALLSSEIAERDRVDSNRVVRYARRLDTPSLTIESETFTLFDGRDTGGQTWFKSLPGDSLSRAGYWRARHPTVTEFYGPDAKALLSEAFVRDHCFTLVERDSMGERLIGLAFVPVEARMRERSPPDIRGTVWLDTASALRSVEFEWTKLGGDVRHVGGEVRFSRVSDGPWVVSSWRLRMPQEVLVVSGQGMSRRKGLVEEGGLVLQDVIDWSTATATVEGFVHAANGRPLAGAVVRVLGTHLSAVSAEHGRYVLNGVPSGVQYVVADHDSVSVYGLRLGQKILVIDQGARRNLDFAAPTVVQVRNSLCQGRPGNRSRATLRVVAVDSTEKPVPGVSVRLSVKGAGAARAADISSGVTDPDGVVVFCDVVAETPLLLTQSQSSQELVFRRGDVVAHSVQVVGRR